MDVFGNGLGLVIECPLIKKFEVTTSGRDFHNYHDLVGPGRRPHINLDQLRSVKILLDPDLKMKPSFSKPV